MSWIKIRDFILTIEFLWFELLEEKKKCIILLYVIQINPKRNLISTRSQNPCHSNVIRFIHVSPI